MARPVPAPEQWAPAVGFRDVEVSTLGAVRGPRGPLHVYRLGRQDIVDIDGRPVAVEVLKAAALAPASQPVKAGPGSAPEPPKPEAKPKPSPAAAKKAAEDEDPKPSTSKKKGA